MSRVYRQMKTGQLDPAIGTKLAFVLASIGKLIEVGDIERRLEVIEDKMRQ